MTSLEDAGTTQDVAQPRTVLDYVILPRPGDVVKWLILPLGYAVGWVGRGSADRVDVVEALVVWGALELLVYQARYQWNDIRGFDADQRHPGGDKGRLPGPYECRRSRVTVSAATATLKVVAAIAICWLVDPATGLLMLGLTAGVFGLAAVYERLRATSTGRSGAVPADVTPGVAMIWVVIGAGYALRAVTGLGLAVDLGDPGLLLPLAVATCWTFGISWITSRWAIEATAFARLHAGELRWRATASDAREHQLALVRWLPAVVPAGARSLRHWRAAEGRARASAPWNIAGVASTAGAAVTGVLLVDPHPGTPALALAAGLGLLSGAVVLAAGPRRDVVAAVAVLVVAVGAVVGVEALWRAATPLLVVLVAQTCYLRQDPASMGQFLRWVPRVVSRAR